MIYALILELSRLKKHPLYYVDEETLEVGRTFGYSNISLVITYTTLVVAALMLAGFLWLAFSYSGNSSGGYGRRKRESPFESDDEGIYNCRISFFERDF